MNKSIIGTLNEKSLHASIKDWYYLPGDKLEARIQGAVIDIIREDMLIEIQTKNFYALKKKLESLLLYNKVVLVHPIAQEKYIVRLSESGELIGRRKSNKKGQLADIFKELISIPDLINNENFSIEVIMIKEEEIRCDNGKGSWRRKGQSIMDRRLLEVLSKTRFENSKSFLAFIPGDIKQPFTNKELARGTGFKYPVAQKITYCLKKMAVIKEVGKRGNELLYEIV